MNITNMDLLRAQYERQDYIRRISFFIGISSEEVQENQEKLRKFSGRATFVEWLKEQLSNSLKMLSSLHASDPSKFPDQECDGVALLKVLYNPPECRIIASYGNIPSEASIPTKPNKVNFTPETPNLKERIFENVDFPYRSLKSIKRDDYIYSIDGQEVKYNKKPQSTLFIPTYAHRTVYGLLYFHSSQKGWFDNCNPFHFLLLGNKLGRFFQYMPPWLEDALSGPIT